MLVSYPELLIFFFLVALLYSAAGFGGGSSYLAILALYPLAYFEVRSTALLCNIMVVTGSVILFHRKGLIDWRKALLLTGTSVPLAYLGGRFPIEPRGFFILLGLSLFAAALLLWFQPSRSENAPVKRNPPWLAPTLGGGIGFLSGLVGIGGGIFLSPVLHLIRWDKAKKIAALAALYILVNSIAGLLGQMANPDFKIDWPFTAALLAAVLVGGQIGVRLTLHRLSHRMVRRITALLIFIVSIRVLIKWL